MFFELLSEIGMDYRARRQALANTLPPNTVAVIPGAREKLRNGDCYYRFRQSSDFYYLTGFQEPDAVLIIFSGKNSISILFNRPRDLVVERWEGPRLGQDLAKQQLLVDEAYSIDELDSRLPELLLDKHAIYFPLACERTQAIVQKAWQIAKGKAYRLRQTPELFADIAPMLGEMRLVKDVSEIACMREAARVSIAAHEQVMRQVAKASNERALEAEFIYTLGQLGGRELAYDAIVAGGARACTLHYTANNQPLQRGTLLLIDAGAEVNCYAADITRTYPIDGRFTPEQRLIYELVWHAQQAGMAVVKPGVSFDCVQKTVVYELTAGLVELGILSGSIEHLISTGAYKTFYMHQASHWLGLDVHDVGAYQTNGCYRLFETGMTLTIEPGLYIPEDCDAVAEKWRGIGVRIEDDLLITPHGHENLTAALAVSPESLEHLISG